MHITAIHEENTATQAPLCNTEKTGSHMTLSLRPTLHNHASMTQDVRTTNNTHEQTDLNDRMVSTHNGRMVGNNEQPQRSGTTKHPPLTEQRWTRMHHVLPCIRSNITASQTVDLQAFSYK